jgi:hypothetical protein
VLRVDRPKRLALDVPWTKVRTENFKVEIDPTYKDRIVPTHATTLALAYDLKRQRAGELGIDFGPVVTGIVSPVWAAVPEPEATAPDPAKRRNVINMTDEESRSGRLGMFLNWEFPRSETFAVGVQLGTAVDGDEPALFLGPTFRLGPYIRLGFGVTAQEVKELDGQEEFRLVDGQVDPKSLVADTAAIKTHNTFDYGGYLSLTIAVDELPFFSPESDE